MTSYSRCVAAFVMAALLAAAPAHAGILPVLGGVTKKTISVSERQALKIARAAAMRAGLAATDKAVLVEATSAGGLRLLDVETGLGRDLGELIATGGLKTTLASVKRIVVPEGLVASHSDQLKSVLRHATMPAAVFTDDGALLPLRLQQLAGREVVLVEVGDKLAMTSEAFGRRSALKALSAQPLLKRMVVLPLVSGEDVVVARAFKSGVRKATAPPATKAEALNIIRRNREALLVVTGHVEGADFVVRTPMGQEAYRLPIAELHAAAEGTKSEVLLLGCQVACAVAHTGPLQNITADAVIRALQGLDPDQSAFQFLNTLADHAGPLLIQEDHRGGFILIDDAVTRASDKAWSRTVSPVRFAVDAATGSEIFVQSSRIWSWGRVFALIGSGLLFILIVLAVAPILGWIYAPLLGLGPKGVWRSVKKERAAVFAGIDELDPVPWPSRAAYVVYGAWVPVLQRLGALLLLLGLILFATVSWVALLATMFFLLIALVRMREVESVAPIGRHTADEDRTVGVIAVFFLLASAASAALSVWIFAPDTLQSVSAALEREEMEFNFMSWRLIWAATPGPVIFGVVYLVLSWPFPGLVGRASAIVFALIVDLPVLLLRSLELKLNGQPRSLQLS